MRSVASVRVRARQRGTRRRASDVGQSREADLAVRECEREGTRQTLGGEEGGARGEKRISERSMEQGKGVGGGWVGAWEEGGYACVRYTGDLSTAHLSLAEAPLVQNTGCNPLTHLGILPQNIFLCQRA